MGRNVGVSMCRNQRLWIQMTERLIYILGWVSFFPEPLPTSNMMLSQSVLHSPSLKSTRRIVVNYVN